ncbi:MAG: hypothetical protein ACON3Z_08990 [Bradymonadia bacterium]
MMGPEELLSAPPITHFVYIPFILLIGGVIGFVVGRKVGARDGEVDYLTRVDDDLLDD